MNRIKILTKSEKKHIENKLKEQFGINSIKGILLKTGTERIFLFQGSLSKNDIESLEESRLNIERIGFYFAKEQGAEYRLSIEGIHILKDQITKNIFKLNKDQLDLWMHGNELNVSSGLNGFVIMEYEGDFLGCGKASKEKITNFIPKSRRLKFKD